MNFLDPTGQSLLSSLFKKIGKAFKNTLDFAESVIKNPGDFIDNLDEIAEGDIVSPALALHHRLRISNPRLLKRKASSLTWRLSSLPLVRESFSMPTLDIEILRRQFTFSPRESGEIVPDDDPGWQQIRRKFLYFACANRPICVVSDGIDGASIVEDFPGAKRLLLPKRRWYHLQRWVWFASSNNCPRHLLDEILSDDEFATGLLFFTSIDNATEERCLSFFTEAQRGLEVADEREMLHGGGDGRLVSWTDPPETLRAQSEMTLRAIADEVGWDCDVSHEK